MDAKDKKERPLSPEIAKLAEKLSKDPKSRLFVPLAEEYLKSGMQEEAIIVLTDGLKIHPNFHAARAMLGRIYFDKGQINDAKTELEAVIKADPENLLAHRKLARIYKNTGEMEKARRSCQAVLMSSPKDAEMKSIINELDRIQEAEQARIQERSTVSAEPSPTEMTVEQTSHAAAEMKIEPERVESPPEPTETLSEPVGEFHPPAELDLKASPVPEAAPVTTPPVIAENNEFRLSLEDILSQPESAPSALVEPAPVPEPEMLKVPEPASDTPPQAQKPAEDITTEALADLYIKQGHYDKGIAIYRRLLSKDPSNQTLFKKLEESVELARVLTEGPQIKTVPDESPEKPPSPVQPAEAARTPEPVPAEPAVPTDREQQKMQKIQRLQNWLDSIKKGQGR